MTVQEFSDQFDVLYNNITSNLAPGLNEYEKSVFLTKGQRETVKNYFSPKGNPKQEGFDSTPKRQADFSTVIKSMPLQPLTLDSSEKFDSRSLVYRFPADVFISLNELLIYNSIPYTIVPISYEEYNRLMSKPYKYPLKNQAWRLMTQSIEAEADFSTKTDTYTPIGGDEAVLRIDSSYPHPVRFIVNTVEASSADTAIGNKPIVSIANNGEVTITCSITLGTESNVYWRAFLLNSATNDRAITLGSPNLEPYVGKFTGEVGDSQFPSFTVPSADITLFDVSNPGGIKGGTTPVVEIIGRFTTAPNYKIRYIKRLLPIIVEELPDGLNIDGYFTPMTSELPEELHDEILQRAVELAKIAWAGNQEELAATQLAMTSGQRSE